MIDSVVIPDTAPAQPAAAGSAGATATTTAATANADPGFALLLALVTLQTDTGPPGTQAVASARTALAEGAEGEVAITPETEAGLPVQGAPAAATATAKIKLAALAAGAAEQAPALALAAGITPAVPAPATAPAVDADAPAGDADEAPVTDDKATPAQSAPVQATPVQATPVQPTPVQPTPVQATLVQATPVQPTPAQPVAVQPPAGIAIQAAAALMAAPAQAAAALEAAPAQAAKPVAEHSPVPEPATPAEADDAAGPVTPAKAPAAHEVKPAAHELEQSRAERQQGTPAVDVTQPSKGAPAPSDDAARVAAPAAPEPERTLQGGADVPKVSPQTVPVTRHAEGPAAPAPVVAPAAVRPRLAPRAVEEVAHAVIRIATREGLPQARINLSPAELGGVEVRLRFHGGGVTAQLSAETAQGGQALQQAVGDLRRTLESQGVAVHGLHVIVAGEGDRMPQRERQAEEQRGQRRRGLRQVEDVQEIEIEATSLPLAAGSVDVLA